MVYIWVHIWVHMVGIWVHGCILGAVRPGDPALACRTARRARLAKESPPGGYPLKHASSAVGRTYGDGAG